MFLDEATIDVSGGTGGHGCVSWRREKYVPKGGPDGGDGGAGGSIILVADANTDTLSDFSSRKRFEAPSGHAGSGQNKAGRDGEDLRLKVPPGCLVQEITEDGKTVVLADLRRHGDEVVIARGGRGGFGNAHFVSSVRQRPDFAEMGEPGEEKMIRMELKLVADVGIIGYPSVGKSTLISVVSAAKPKIAAYHFTTLIPNLGVVTVGGRSTSTRAAGARSFVICDVPGLIEGASEGKGLGDAFLKHIERCGVLLHVLDISRALGMENAIDPEVLIADYRMIRRELEAYSPSLTAKRELVILNKSDLVAGDTKDIEKALNKEKIPVFAAISAATRQGTDALMEKLVPIVLEEREKREKIFEDEQSADKPLPVLRPHLDSDKMGAYTVKKSEDGSIHVRGKRIEQFTVMTDFRQSGSVLRFRDVMNRIGVYKALKREGYTDDTPVYIGKVRVDEFL